jgi:hypothetical protein
MEYKLELKPFERKDGVKYKIIELTDIQLHTTFKEPSSVGKNFKKTLETDQPVRIYSPLLKQNLINDRFTILDVVKKDPVLLKTVQDYEKDGFKVLISIPKVGVPLSYGKDTVEFINSKNGQRVIRGLAKNKPTD